jgi:3-isopropylmalate dehydrogenase
MAHRIAVIPGDGVGPEVIREGVKVLQAASEVAGGELSFEEFPYGGEYYLKTGHLLEEEDLKELSRFDAIYLGAVGDPRVPPGVLEKGLLLTLRLYFDQYVNLRPIKLYPGVSCPLKDKKPEDIDFYVVRENTEDFYVGLGGRGKGKWREEHRMRRELYQLKLGLDLETGGEEIAYQLGVMSRRGAERVIRYAFELARREGRRKVTAVDKANVLTHLYGLWREVFQEVAKDYGEIETEFSFVDALTMWMVKNPEHYEVVVTPNMFGDILTDLGAMLQGGMGLAPGGNLNPEGLSMFEPIHGSAPKYAGRGVANPLAAILAGKMMLEELGEREASKAVEEAVKGVLREGRHLTRDLGGNSKTQEVGEAVVRKLREQHEG